MNRFKRIKSSNSFFNLKIFFNMSLVLTLMQPLRVRYDAQNGLDKNELRRSRYGALDFYQQQSRLATGVISGEMRGKIKESMGNTVQVPVLDARDVVITNVRSCVVADDENTSKLVTLTFVTYAFGFTMIPAQYNNNDISYRDDFNRKLELYLLKAADTLDTACVNNLSTNKNQYFPAAITGYYPQVGNALQVTQAQKNDFYNQASAVLNTMDFYGQTHVISSTTGKPMVNRLQAQGNGNAVNEDFQFAGYDWYYTNRLGNGAGIQSTAYLVADGMVAMENRNSPDSRANSRTGNGKEWGEALLPILNMTWGTYYYDDCADKSALHAGTAHLTQTRVEGFEFSTDVCFVNAYNSAPATKYGPILKAEISAT
jgi:hypothetical protein